MKTESGFSLIEVILSLAIMTIVALGILSSLSNTSKSVMTTDVLETARNLAESQMEYIKSLSYFTSYSPAPVSSEYANYSVTIYTNSINARDANIQKIRVIVSHQGTPIIITDNSTLEDYKVNR